ncbi:MAG: Xaa-Pro peptidase family protein [Acidobacteriota bacterium]
MRLTRRHWMAATGAATAAAFLPSHPLAAAPNEPPLPAALPPEVFRDRQARLRAAAKAQGFDALLVTPSTNLAYTANISMGRSERLTALLLFSDGPAALLTPSFEEDNVRRGAVVDDVATWKEDEDPIARAAKMLARAKTIGVEGSTAYGTLARLLAAAPAQAQDAGSLFDALRMIKSAQEQAFLKEAARRTSLAIAATHKRLSRGMTESEVANVLEQEFQRLGVHGDGLVQFGPSSALPHGGPGDRRLAVGDVVLIDSGCRVRGYTSDVTRTVSFGAPSDEVRKVYAVVNRAQMAGIDALRAGVPAQDVDRAARRVIEDAGYGAFFTHRLGHGLGMDGHEPPYLVRGNTASLFPGNTVTIEPGIYLPGKFGVRIEDDYGALESAPPTSLSVRPGELVVLNT